MKNKSQLVLSGIPLVDKEWGGFYSGRNYLLVGQHNSGKTSFVLQFVREGVKRNESILYLTSVSVKEVKNYCAKIDFDIQKYIDQNLINIVRVIPPIGIFNSINRDEFLAAYFQDIKNLVEEYLPTRIVFDEMTSFIEFENLTNLMHTYQKTIKCFDKLDLTNLFILRDPATEITQRFVDSLAVSSTGIIFLQKNEDIENEGEITITPNLSHPEGKFKGKYIINSN